MWSVFDTWSQAKLKLRVSRKPAHGSRSFVAQTRRGKSAAWASGRRGPGLEPSLANLFGKALPRRRISVRIALAALFLLGPLAPLRGAEALNGHPVVLDASGKLLSWVTPQEAAYDRVMRLAWDYLLHGVPIESNGLKVFFTYCCLDPQKLRGVAWPHNSAGLYAMLADSAAAYYAYSGDRAVVELVGNLLDYQLTHGTTPAEWRWGSVPYASSDHGATEYRGAHDFLYDRKHPGRGDGYGVIEPDKLGELGYGYVKFYELTGDVRYRDAALSCANALARHVRPGDAEHSPWPFRVYAETDVAREEYSANVIGPVHLFDALVWLNLGDVPSYRRARQVAWTWLMAYPMRTSRWSTYFEDVYIIEPPDNYNQYSPLETARYILQHVEYDPDWRDHVSKILKWVEDTFGRDVPNEPGNQWGATTISEQLHDMHKMGSHTSRYASVNALWYEKTGDAAAKEKAFRSFNWATYMCHENGLVNDMPVKEQSIWFSDGYGDYIRHFMAGLGSVPEWAPAEENHLLRSSSVIRSVSYLPNEINYLTSDDASTEVLRTNFTPRRVTADGKELAKRADLAQPGWIFDERLRVLTIRHEGSHVIGVLGGLR